MTTVCWMDTSALDLARLTPTIPLWRREKIGQYRFDKDKRLSLGASLLLAQCGVADEIACAEHGKPYFLHRADVRFSLSHSGTVAVCAFSGHEIGCDIEQIDQRHLSLADRCLTPREKDFLAQSDDPARTFTRFWVCKESVMKYTGLGLSLPPWEIEIDLEHGTWENCRLREFSDIEGYCLALCAEKAQDERASLIQIGQKGTI